jgi:hypothetical protein
MFDYGLESDYGMESANKVAPAADTFADTLFEEPTKSNAKTMCHNTLDYSMESADNNASTIVTASVKSTQVKHEDQQGGVSYSHIDNG